MRSNVTHKANASPFTMSHQLPKIDRIKAMQWIKARRGPMYVPSRAPHKSISILSRVIELITAMKRASLGFGF